MQLFFPRLESDEPEKMGTRKSTKRVINRTIYDEYTFTNKGTVKIYRFKRISRHLIIIFGEKSLKTIETTLSVISLVSLIGILCLVFMSLFVPVSESYTDEISPLFITMIISLILFSGVTTVLEYYRDSICRLCGEKFACEEIKEPIIKEISKENEYSVMIKRYWKCKFCDSLEIREEHEGITASKGDWKSKKDLKKIRCENCREANVIEEFRRSDIKRQGDNLTTRNYYKCSNCGYINIKEKEEIITPPSP